VPESRTQLTAHHQEETVNDTRTVIDRHTEWACVAGATLIVEATTPGAGDLPSLHAVIYACALHQEEAAGRIATAGYSVSTRPAPPSHRWAAWPCGSITAYDTHTADALTATVGNLADRIAAVQRPGHVTEEQRAAARDLLTDMLAAAGRHGVTLADLDYLTDLPGVCLDAVRRRA
jgi:hypothetical protein